MSAPCSILEFLEMGDDLVVSLHTHRYGGGIVAMVCRPDRLDDFVDSIEGNNGESEWELWGLRDSWYPVVEGSSINDALNRLRAKLKSDRAHWSVIHTAISIMPSFPSPAKERVKCKVVTFDDLHNAISKWNEGICVF